MIVAITSSTTTSRKKKKKIKKEMSFVTHFCWSRLLCQTNRPPPGSFFISLLYFSFSHAWWIYWQHALRCGNDWWPVFRLSTRTIAKRTAIVLHRWCRSTLSNSAIKINGSCIYTWVWSPDKIVHQRYSGGFSSSRRQSFDLLSVLRPKFTRVRLRHRLLTVAQSTPTSIPLWMRWGMRRVAAGLIGL